VFAKFDSERQARAKARAAEIIAEELALRDVRKERLVTQEQVAQRLGAK
jgi:ribosomal protein S25